MGCERIGYLEKEKNYRFLMNRGIETGIDYVGKRQKNHGFETNCIWKKKITDGFWTNSGFEISRDYK